MPNTFLRHESSGSRRATTLNVSPETPTIVGAAAIGVFIICVVYQMLCKKKCCQNCSCSRDVEVNGSAQWSGVNEWRHFLRSQRLTGDSEAASTRGHRTSLPEYDDLPPSYLHVVTKLTTQPSENSLNSDYLHPPPAYEPKESRLLQTTIV